MKKTLRRLLACLLLCALLPLTGCGAQSRDLMRGVTPQPLSAKADLDDHNTAVTDFALRLLRACEDGENNTVLSPLSVLCALGMTVNGAEGETKQQMEAVLGMSAQELNGYLAAYLRALPQGDKCKLHTANSIWLTEDERFTVEPDFLQTNADYYGADIYAAPFDDSTVQEINRWVKNNTHGMIDKVLQTIPDDAVMYLINALAFEAEWMDIYEKYQVCDGIFTREDGAEVNAELMYSDEHLYLACDSATGFLKRYKDGKYAFAALLPREGVSVTDCLASLDGETLHQMLSAPQQATVYTAIPKFETECSVELADILQAMGMRDAFDPDRADFGGLGSSTDGSVHISRVVHKTFLSVAEKGTRAGAATMVAVADGAAAPQEPKAVYLDRPFICLLVDMENAVPFFMGTVMDVG